MRVSLEAEYIEVNDLGQEASPTYMIGYRYNPNLPNIEISLIYSNIPPQSQRERRRR